MSKTEQRTLTGDEADGGRHLPRTIIHCVTCRERILRSRARTHADDHDALPRPRWDNQFIEPTDGRIDG